jgi:dihydrolipoamide dehydrogenase
MAEVQDLIVIGGGAGGFAAAMRAAQLGGQVTVVESAYYGGNCMNKACIPLTFLMSAARLMGQIRQAESFGLQVGEPRPDMDELHERKDLIIEGLRMGTEQLLSDYGIALVEGRGRLVAQDTVEVTPSTGSGPGPSTGGDGERIKARNVVVATGSVPAQLPIEGADLPGVMGTEEVVELREVPARVAVVGGRPWDLEIAQYFHLLGSQVTLIESGAQLLPEADHEIAQRLGKLFYDAGIIIKRRAAVEAIRQGDVREPQSNDDDALTVVLAEGKGEVVADKVLAARRFPNTAGLGLRELGVNMEGGGVLVNERMETSVPHVYAIGDATAGPMWSHKANAEGIVAGENAMGLTSRMNYDIMPHCLYTWPQIAWVGLTEEQAEAQGIEVDIGKVPTAINPYAMILEQTAGMIKVISCKKYGKILGVHVMAPGAVDLINAAAMAMLAEATVGELMRFIPRHPSIGEALVDAAMDVERRSLHLPQW